jgi:DNA polymerase III gamma/tau subunit
LFVGQNIELTNSKVKEIAIKLLKDFNIPENYLYILEDSPENIKIKELKEFIEFSHSQAPYSFQIFFIQNISRFTLTSSNSLLKLLEEPGKQNIIFLTNT